MQDHPIPQHISSYQFHLIGSMTLKQFLYLTGGMLGAWVFYSLPILAIFKWPLVILSGLSGVSLAFVPYQDRPLDEWLTSFIKAIYNPTQFLWKKQPQLPEFLKPQTSKATPSSPTPQPPSKKQPLKNYLQSLPPSSPKNKLDLKEQKSLQTINQLFQLDHTPSSPTSKTQPEKIIKSVKVKIRQLKTPPPNFAQPSPPALFTKPTPPKTPHKPTPPATKPQPLSLASQPQTKTSHQTVGAVVNPRLPFPSTPTIPNIIVGMTLDHNRNILEEVIIEIRDSKGHPVRALKSNKLGQFFIATPLANGLYEVEAEKEGYSFDIVKLKLEGKIIQPIEIRAKTKLDLPRRQADLTNTSPPTTTPQPPPALTQPPTFTTT